MNPVRTLAPPHPVGPDPQGPHTAGGVTPGFLPRIAATTVSVFAFGAAGTTMFRCKLGMAPAWTIVRGSTLVGR